MQPRSSFHARGAHTSSPGLALRTRTDSGASVPRATGLRRGACGGLPVPWAFTKRRVG